MGDVAKGIKSFKKGMSSDETDQTKNPPIQEDSKEDTDPEKK